MSSLRSGRFSWVVAAFFIASIVSAQTQSSFSLAPPTKEQLFKVENESAVFARWKQEHMDKVKLENEKIDQENKLIDQENERNKEANLPLKTRKQKQSFGFEFPKDDLVKAVYVPRSLAPSNVFCCPSYVVHNPLYFQQLNPERYGWEMGVFQPIVSTAQFYGDVLLLPYKVAVNKPWDCDTHTGYYLPGDCVPLYFYTPLFSWKGVLSEATTAVVGSAVIP